MQADRRGASEFRAFSLPARGRGAPVALPSVAVVAVAKSTPARLQAAVKGLPRAKRADAQA